VHFARFSCPTLFLHVALFSIFDDIINSKILRRFQSILFHANLSLNMKALDEVEFAVIQAASVVKPCVFIPARGKAKK